MGKIDLLCGGEGKGEREERRYTGKKGKGIVRVEDEREDRRKIGKEKGINNK